MGLVHPWVGQKLLKCNDVKRYSSVLAKDELRGTRPLTEATADLS